MDSFRERLEHWMTVRNIKAKPLSKKAGLNETMIRDLLKRTTNPGLDTVAKLCAALEIYPHDLVPEIRALYPPEALKLLNKFFNIQEEKRAIEKEFGKSD